jgi:PAS domain S-box-containing protein
LNHAEDAEIKEEGGTKNPVAKILVVDDEATNLLAFREILSDPSYEVITASDADAALKALLVHDFAVLLLDVFMEGMSGLELATLVKTRKKLQHIPIIFLTALRADQEFIHRAYEVGAADFIEKPVSPEIMRAKVAAFVELYRKTKEVARQAKQLHDSEVKNKEVQLSELRASSEKRFQDLVEGIDHGFVWSADPSSMTFSYMSPRAELILGQPIEDWNTRPGLWLEHVHPEDREAVREVFNGAQTGKDLGLEHRFTRNDGETIWLRTGVRLARKGLGVGIELRGLSFDITYMKEIESALKAAVEARDEFLSIASHELRTPITPILLQLQLLERAMKQGDNSMIAPEKIMRTLDSWSKQVGRLSHLIEDMLDLSRISAGRLNIVPEEMDLRFLVDEVVRRHSDQGAHVGVEIHVSGPERVEGFWDLQRIEQVLTNLLTNAFKFAPGRPVDIEIGVEEDSVSLVVQDHGAGIAPEKQGRIFDRFERATDSSHVSGLGLGLYIAKNIVDAHEGTITVFSQVEKGARFVVKLPKRTRIEKAA